jgi:phosphoribosyl 1,2-cyclic phosphate phosphodiesterase
MMSTQFCAWTIKKLKTSRMSNFVRNFKLIQLGTGTSSGIPAPGCVCAACKSTDPRDYRLRTSAFLTDSNGLNILIDCGPDLRRQVLTHNITNLSFVLETHPHADHIHGINDLTAFSLERPLDIYGNEETLDEMRERFRYIFRETELGETKPQIVLKPIDGPFDVQGLHIIPLPIKHGGLDIFGYRIGNLAYITDASFVPPTTIELMNGIEYLIVNTLREESHPTHFRFDETIEFVSHTTAKQVWCVHLAHHKTHEEVQRYFDEHKSQYASLNDTVITIAHDGLTIENILA